MLLGTLISIPFMIAKEGAKWGEFVTTFNTNPIVSFNLIASGEFFFNVFFQRFLSMFRVQFVSRSVRVGRWVHSLAGHVQRQIFCMDESWRT